MLKLPSIFALFLFALCFTVFSCEKPDEPITCDQVEQIDPNCIYTADYNPVCGCNGKTYSNAGHAQCSGITTYTEGACK